MEQKINEPREEEKVKVSKMSKGYNWEIKLLGKPEDNLERIRKIDLELKKSLAPELIPTETIVNTVKKQ